MTRSTGVTKAAFADGTAIIYQYDQGAGGIGRITTMSDAGGHDHMGLQCPWSGDGKAANQRQPRADHKPHLQCDDRAARQPHLSLRIVFPVFLRCEWAGKRGSVPAGRAC